MFWKQILYSRHWYTRKQFEHHGNFMFVYVPLHPRETLGEPRQWHPAEPAQGRITHTSNICDLPQFTKNISHTHPCLEFLLLRFSIQAPENLHLLLQNHTGAATLSRCTSTSKLQIFFKVRCHTYYTRRVFLDHLAYVSYQFY